MGTELIVARRAEDLLAPFARWMRRPRVDPFAPDFIVIPRVSVRDFLIERLPPMLGEKGRGGVLANAEFWLPEEFNRRSLGQHEVTLDSWNNESLAWAILEVMSKRPELVPNSRSITRKFSVALAIATLFNRYMLQRPEMIYAWSRGILTDGVRKLDDSVSWQFDLWNEVRGSHGVSPAEVSVEVLAKSGDQHPLFDYGQNLAFFGIDYVSPFRAIQIQRLSSAVDLSVFALAVSEHVYRNAGPINLETIPERSNSVGVGTIKSDLLRAWARPAAEAAGILKGLATTEQIIDPRFANNFLGEIQRSISSPDQLPTVRERIDSELLSDGSVQIHKCHGAVRQVEVVRDALLHILDTRPDISARDVLIVCPELERFESLVRPILEQKVDGQSLRVAVLGGSRETESVFDTTDSFLDLASGRMAATDVLLTISHSAVQERFGIATEDLSRFSHWSDMLDVRWGLDAKSRLKAGYPEDYVFGTWSHAVERLAMGMFFPNEDDAEVINGVAPYDDLVSSDFESVGRLWSFVSLVKQTRTKIEQGLSYQGWADLLDSLASNLFDISDEGVLSQLDELRQFAQTLRKVSGQLSSVHVSVLDVRSALRASAPPRRGFASYWSDGIRVGGLTALQGIAAKVVVLLGLDHGSLRQGDSDGDDILGFHPRVGDRDPRLEDRVALLSLLQSAEDFFILVCNGFDVTNNKKISNTIVLEELTDHISRVAHVSSLQLTKPLVVEHTRQLADVRNLSSNPFSDKKALSDLASIWGRPWTFDPTSLEIVRSQDVQSTSSHPNLGEINLSPMNSPSAILDLRDLEDGFRDPFRVLLEKRLGISLPRKEDHKSDLVDLWPGSLEYWKLGEGLLKHRLQGDSTDVWAEQVRAQGLLPAGLLGQKLIVELEELVGELVPFVPVDMSGCVSALLSFEISGRRICGQVRRSNSVVPYVGFSKWDRSRRLSPWIDIASLTVNDSSTKWEAVSVYRASEKRPTSVSKSSVSVERFSIAGNSPAERLEHANEILEFAIWLREQALCSYVPFFRRASWVWIDQKPTNVKTALAQDLSESVLSELYPDIDYSYLKNEVSTSVEHELPEGNCRAERYALKLKQLWEKGTEVVQSAENAKKDKVSK